MVQYFSEAFFNALAETANADSDFQAKGKKLKAKMLMVAKDRNEAFLIVADGGKVSATKSAPDADADFGFIADYDQWVTSHKGEMPLEKGIMTGKVKFKGSMLKIMPIRAALASLDDVARKVPAEY